MNQKETMKDMFKGYSNYTNDEYKRIWHEAIIVVDTNILLNFYKYSKETTEGILKILEKLKHRLWIPYQVGKEFFDNKNNVMIKSYNKYDEMADSIKQHFCAIKDEVNKNKNSELKCKSNISKIIDTSIKQIEELLIKEKDEKKPKFEEDKIEENIFNLFNNCIGEKYDEEEYSKIKIEGQRRFENKIPPGYKDNDKDENGDYYIFYSLIKKSNKEKKDIIFITDDTKEDWFYKLNGEIHGGRPELLNEFYKNTNNLLMLYTSDGFLKSYYKNIDNKEVNETIIKELRMVRSKENILSKKHLPSSLKNKEFINMLQYYKHNLMVSSNNFENEKLLNHISFIIENIDISTCNKHIFKNQLENIKNIAYVMNDIEYANEKLINLIERIISNHNHEYKSIRYYKIKLNRIKNNYMNLLLELKTCKTKNDQQEVYINVCDNIKEHIKLIEESPYKYHYELTSKLENLLIMLSNNTETYKKDKILIEIETILKDEEIFINN